MSIPGYDQWKLQAPGDGPYDQIEEPDEEWTEEDEAAYQEHWADQRAMDEDIEAGERMVASELRERDERDFLGR